MGRPRIFETFERGNYRLPESTTKAIRESKYLSDKVGIPGIKTDSDVVRTAVEEFEHLLRIEQMNPGSVKFKSKIIG